MAVDVEEYYTKYGPMVLRRCRFLLKNEEKALDAMQDVFVKLLIYQDKLKGTYPSSLLYKIATNLCLNILRAEKKLPEMESEEVLQNIACSEETEKRFILKDLLDFIFQREPDTTREMAVMFFIDGMTLEQVANEFNFSVSGVRKRLRNLTAKVKILNGAEIL